MFFVAAELLEEIRFSAEVIGPAIMVDLQKKIETHTIDPAIRKRDEFRLIKAAETCIDHVRHMNRSLSPYPDPLIPPSIPHPNSLERS